MKLKNSYILLKNEYNRNSIKSGRDENGTLVIQVGYSVTSYIRKCYPGLNKQEENDNFFRKIYRGEIEFGQHKHEVEFKVNEVVNTIYLEICVEARSKKQIIECLEEIQTKLFSSGIRENYIDIISYDSISEFYCNKMYSYLNTLERNLRKLFFNIYVLNFGSQFYSETIDKSLRDSVQSIIKQDTKSLKGQYKREYSLANNSQFDEITIIQRLFYSFDYNDMILFLFTSTWTDYNENKKNELLLENKDLSALSNEELKEIINDLSPKSNWDRFFSEKIKLVDAESIFNSIRVYRNSVAHFKFFYKKEYDMCLKEVKQLNKAVVDAIKITEQEDFDKKNAEYIRTMLMPIVEEMLNGVRMFARKAREKVNNFWKSEIYAKIKESLDEIGEFSVDNYSKESLLEQENIDENKSDNPNDINDDE